MDTLVVAELGAPAGGGGGGGAGPRPAAANGAKGGANAAAGGAAAGRGGGNSGGLTGSDGVVTSLAFRPDVSGSRMQNVLLAAQVRLDGEVGEWELGWEAGRWVGS